MRAQRWRTRARHRTRACAWPRASSCRLFPGISGPGVHDPPSVCLCNSACHLRSSPWRSPHHRSPCSSSSQDHDLGHGRPLSPSPLHPPQRPLRKRSPPPWSCGAFCFFCAARPRPVAQSGRGQPQRRPWQAFETAPLRRRE
eukprot:Amastigsp_a676889_94.p4 type:complete len:142 gc:universal Amastigsp_a676889_94:978-1403(+)